MLLCATRRSPGTKAMAPSTAPIMVVNSTAAGAASRIGQPKPVCMLCASSAPRMQKPPCARLMTPVTRNTSEKPTASKRVDAALQDTAEPDLDGLVHARVLRITSERQRRSAG